MRHAAREVWVATAVLLISLAFLVHLIRATDWSTRMALSPTSMPLFVISLVVLFSLGLLLTALLQVRRSHSEGTTVRVRPTARAPDKGEPHPKRGFALLSWTILYLVALPWLGYLLTTTAYTGGLAFLFGNRRPSSIILLMVLVPASLLLFFERYLRIWLPAGRLFQ